MDRRRIRNFSLGALAGVVLVALIGAGGFPSRPKFQAVGINTAAPAQVGGLALVPSAPGGGATITVAATAGNAARAEFAGNGNVIGSTGMLYGQDASDIGYLWNRANQEVRFGTNNAHRGSVSASGGFDWLGAAISISNATNPALSVTDTTTPVTSKLQSLDGAGLVGTETNHPFEIRTSNIARITCTSGGACDFTVTPTVNSAALATSAGGSYSAAITGCTTSPNATINWVRIGSMVTMTLPTTSCTSNATSLTWSGANSPTANRPANTTGAVVLCAHTNNSVQEYGITSVNVQTDGALWFIRNGSVTGFTAANLKGLSCTSEITYAVD